MKCSFLPWGWCKGLSGACIVISKLCCLSWHLWVSICNRSYYYYYYCHAAWLGDLPFLTRDWTWVIAEKSLNCNRGPPGNVVSLLKVLSCNHARHFLPTHPGSHLHPACSLQIKVNSSVTSTSMPSETLAARLRPSWNSHRCVSTGRDGEGELTLDTGQGTTGPTKNF